MYVCVWVCVCLGLCMCVSVPRTWLQLWLEWFGKDGVEACGREDSPPRKFPQVYGWGSNSLQTEPVPTTGRQVVRGSLGMERGDHFGLGRAWHSEVGERVPRSPEELPECQDPGFCVTCPHGPWGLLVCRPQTSPHPLVPGLGLFLSTPVGSYYSPWPLFSLPIDSTQQELENFQAMSD